MHWRARSTRHAADFPPDGEAALRPVPGLGGVGLGGVALAGAGLSGAGLGKSGLGKSEMGKSGLGTSGLTHLSARSGGSKFSVGSGSLPNGAAKGNSSSETAHESAQRAQPSGADGVPEDMATLVLDKSALGDRKSTRLNSSHLG